MTDITTVRMAAVDHYPRLVAARAARVQFRAGEPGAHRRDPADAAAAKAEEDAAWAETAGMLCTRCGGTGQYDSRPERDFARDASRALGVLVEGPLTVSYGACHRCDNGWARRVQGPLTAEQAAAEIEYHRQADRR